MDLTFIIGIVGMFCILLAFILDEFVRKFNQETIQYNSLNILGASLLVYYAYVSVVWPFVILNVVWVIAAVIKLIKITSK